MERDERPLYDAYGVSIPKHANKETSEENSSNQQPLRPKKLQWLRQLIRLIRRHLVWRTVGGVLALAATTATLLGFLDLVFGRHLWPSAPTIEARDSINGSSSVLPFAIRSTSIFPIGHALLSCYVNLAYVMDSDRKTILMRDSQFIEGATEINQETNYYCNSQYLSVGQDGSLAIGFPNRQNLRTKPGLFTAPLTILKLCVMVNGTYSTLGVNRKFESAMFQWPADPKNPQWIKGPIAFDDDQSKWIPENSILGAAYGLRRLTGKNSDGTTYLLTSALKCDVAN